MRILLIDLDSKIPNLALMKLSAYHKSKGDEVYLGYCDCPDRVYASSVFTKSKLQRDQVKAVYPNAIVGGTGYGLDNFLEPEIERMRPDYELYGIDYGIGFTSRGCIRKCSFCVVPQKEGGIRSVSDIPSLINGKKLVLLDNNFLAQPEWKERFEEIFLCDLKVDFNQGLDIRLIDDEKAKYLASTYCFPYLRFAFDHISGEKALRKGLDTLKKAGRTINRQRIGCFVLVGYNSMHEEDLYRLNLLHSLDINTHVQVYEGSKPITKHLARWGNRPWLWTKIPFSEYKRAKKTENQLVLGGFTQ